MHFIGRLLSRRFALLAADAPANAEFTTASFEWPEGGRLALNAAARWGQDRAAVEHCDEQCAAYIMAELRSADGTTIAGYEKERCVMMDVDGLALPLRWDGAPPIAAGTKVALRLYFRDATIFALSVGA